MMLTKIEVTFAKVDKETGEIVGLGGFSIDGDEMPAVVIPSIGELVIFKRDGKFFSGTVVTKNVVYDDADIAGHPWDFVTNVFIILDPDDVA